MTLAPTNPIQGGGTSGNYAEDAEGNENEEDQGLHEDSDKDIDKTKPIKLNIESRPPEKSPFEKIFSTVILNLSNCLELNRKIQNSTSNKEP